MIYQQDLRGWARLAKVSSSLGLLHVDPRWYLSWTDMQRGVCHLHERCQRGLVYKPWQGREDNTDGRRISVGIYDRRGGTASLHDGLSQEAAYACVYSIFQ